MKEQDFIHNIEEKTKNLPIPDSISPDSMKIMLDNTIKQDHTTQAADSICDSEDTDNFTDSSSTVKSSTTGKKNRYIRRFTAAACVVLCLAGTFGISKLLTNHSTDSLVTKNETASQEKSAAEEPEHFDEDLAYQTNLDSPSSYEEYYNTLKSAYDSYYDSISSVDTYGKELEVSPDSVPAAESAAMEDSGATNSSFSANDKSLATGATKDYSTTNTQEKAVDEGDIIKTDGTYIYKVISGFDNDTGYTRYRLTITKTDNGNLSTVTSFDLEDAVKKKDSDDSIHFQEFYLYENQLILMYTISNYSADITANESIIVIYDLKDKKNPKMVKTLSQSGWYESSRISNGYLYTISNFSDTSLAVKENYDDYIPTLNGKTIECKNIFYPKDILMESTYVITSLDLKNPEAFADTKAVPTSGGSTYVSDSSIYLYATIYSEVNKTEIMKIGYDEGKLTVGNSAVVAGYVYNSFALSEYNGHLRIVTTIPANNISLLRNFALEDAAQNSSSVREDVNALYILDSSMNLTGKITGLAPGEQIYSARFMGDIGYFVTYRNTDPLFSVDLSDPANPKILGELKIPGFSNYLHFYGKNTLLGIGEETDPNTQEFLGLKLSMFDISNPADVKEKDKYIIENSDFSEALYNHKAIMIDTDKNLFGFLYYGTKDNSYEYSYYYATYTYDTEQGFIQTAAYPINNGSEYESSSVRGLYIGDYFYLTTNKSITSYEIGSENPIALVYLK